MSKSKKHQRDCPALGRAITAAECGSGRGSAHACPADCPHFPFTPANYDLHGEIESRLIQKTYERAARTMTDAERERMIRVLDTTAGAPDEMLVNHARFVWLYHGQRDAEGRTFGERWLADKTGGLSNDERVLLAGMNRLRPVLLEVHRIVDEQTIEGVDLLDGSALRIVDRATSASVGRYCVLLAWCYPMAHYERSSGAARFVEEVQEMAPQDVVREVIRHLGGPADPAGERRWLMEHFARMCAALGAVQVARWQNTMAAIDGRYTKTDYRILQRAPLFSLLAKQRDLHDEPLADEEIAQGFETAYVSVESAPVQDPDQLPLPLPGEPKFAAGNAVLGRVLLGRERVRIEAMSQDRHQAFRTRFERLAKGKVEFLGERTDDLATQSMAGKVPAFDTALVPPRLLENPQRITLASQRLAESAGDPEHALLDALRQQYVGFPDEPFPWLEDRTPRAAAADPALRPKLVALMKTHIRGCDARRRKEGLDLDLNPLLADLGLHELISEPPPLGFAEEEWDEDELSEDAAAAFDELVSLGSGLGPHAVMPPLSEHEVDLRLKATGKRYPDPDTAADAIDDAFPGLIDFAWDATQSTLDESGWTFLDFLIVRACHVMKPSSGPPLTLNFELMVRGIAGEFAAVSKAVLSPGRRREAAMEHWLMQTPQPIVMQDLAGTLLTASEKVPRKDRPSDDGVLVILSFLKALVAELSRARA